MNPQSSTRRNFLNSIGSGALAFALVRCTSIEFTEPIIAEAEPIDPPPLLELAAPDELGTRLILSGFITSETGAPWSEARLTFWQVDSTGEYGHLRDSIHTDAHGRYQVSTIKPVSYQVEDTVRAAHIHYTASHIKTNELSGEILFEGDPELAVDPVFLELTPEQKATHRTILLTQRPDGTLQGEFNIVLKQVR